MTHTLLIDSAFDVCQVGLAVDGRVTIARQSDSGGGHDRVLAGMTDAVLHEGGITIAALNQIAVTTGPGRFNGLRVGIAFARGLALVQRTTLVGLSTTDLLALDLRAAFPDDNNMAVLLSVKRGESLVRYGGDDPTIHTVLDADLGVTLRTTRVAGFISPTTQALLQQAGITVLDGFAAPQLQIMADLAAEQRDENATAVRPYYGAHAPVPHI